MVEDDDRRMAAVQKALLARTLGVKLSIGCENVGIEVMEQVVAAAL